MIRAYSQRLLPPYSGVVQIAESRRARAQSFDGINWELHYLPENGTNHGQFRRAQGYALDRSFYKIAHVQNQQLSTYSSLPRLLDPDEIAECIDELYSFLTVAKLPFPFADRYEFWLLDEQDGVPLALLYSCCEEGQKSSYPSRPIWTALPHSKMQVDNTADEQERREAPVNQRLQDLVSRRAGQQPLGAWYNRDEDCGVQFPSFLLRSDWSDSAGQDLFQRYLERKSPRLLMLQGLSLEERSQLEQAARQYALEVDDYFLLYPEVADKRLMAAIRVEAKLRRHAKPKAKPADRENKPSVQPLSKDMRIIEN